MRSKKQIKQQLGKGIVDMIHAKQAGVKFKPGRRDGGIPTKPVVPCADLLEAEVLKNCISWLKRHRVGVKRMNVTAVDLNGGGVRPYGIKGAGDLHCIYKGIHIDVECKRGKGGVLSLNQQKHRDWVEQYEGVYLVVHGIEELEFFMLSIIQGDQ